jgi:O-succinylbenzoic acid--CoA ligase
MEAWLARAARMHGARTAMSTREGSRHTYSELYARARAVAGGLCARGIGAGDRVALALPSEELVVALHACLLIGAAALPVDLRLTAVERTARTETAALMLEQLVEGAPLAPAAATGHDPATIMFTSGTTAGPKEVALSHGNWLWNALGSSLALGLDQDERWLCPMPLAHVGGLSVSIRSVIYGTEVVLHEHFDTEAALATLMDGAARVTLASLVPTMLSRLLEAGLRRPPTLRWALLGGGPIAPALLDWAREAGVPVAPSYGMTEACSQIATAGWPLLGTELALGSDGEVLVRGPTVAAGALASDGWLHTGDRGSFDAEGRLRIEGRIADTIVTGGENVSPVEVEAVLLEHPEIRDAAVFGRPDPEWGEAVVAQVVLRDPAAGAVAEANLHDHCGERLARFKVPKVFETVAAVPRGVTGKLLRRELR